MLTKIREFLIDYPDALNIAMVVLCLLVTLFFHYQSKKIKSKALLGYLPGLWTSGGILFTFISIYVSLSDGFTGGVSQLIKTIIPAFSTSIIGILMAIGYSAYLKLRECKDDKEEERRYLDITDNRNPEQVLYDIKHGIDQSVDNSTQRLEAMAALVQESNQHLTNISDNEESFKDQVTEAFRISLEKQDKTFETALGRQQEVFLDVMSDMMKEINDKFENIISLYKKQIDAFSAESRVALNDIVSKSKNEADSRTNEFKSYIQEERESISTFVFGIEQKFKEHTDELNNLYKYEVKNAIENFGKAQFEKSASMVELLNTQMIENSKQLIENQTAQIESIWDKMSSAQVENLETLMEANVTKFQSICEESNKKHAEELQQMVDQFKSSTDDALIKNLTTVEEFESLITKELENIITISKNAYSNINETSEATNSLVAHMKDAHSQIASQFTQFYEKIASDDIEKQELFKEQNANFVNAVMASLKDVSAKNTMHCIEQIKEYADSLKKGYSDHMDFIMEKTTKDFDANIEKNNIMWNTMLTDSRTAQNTINSALEIVSGTSTAIESSLKQLSESITTSFDNFKAQQEKQQEVILSANAQTASELSTKVEKYLEEALKLADIEKKSQEFFENVKNSMEFVGINCHSISQNVSALNKELEGNTQKLGEFVELAKKNGNSKPAQPQNYRSQQGPNHNGKNSFKR